MYRKYFLHKNTKYTKTWIFDHGKVNKIVRNRSFWEEEKGEMYRYKTNLKNEIIIILCRIKNNRKKEQNYTGTNSKFILESQN